MAYEDIGLLVTAKHVVREVDPDSLLVFPTDSSNESIRLLSLARIDGDASFQDLAFFPFWRSEIDHQAPGWDQNALPLTRDIVVNGRSAYRGGEEVVLAGMPGAVRDIDHESKKVFLAHALLPARYDAPDSSREWIHRGTMTNTAGLQSFDGFSGGAVLRIAPTVWGLAGCVIEGTISSKIFHFIDSAVVWNAASRLRSEL